MSRLANRREFLSAAALTGFARTGEKEKISVLIVDGINNHDWRAGTDAAREILEATGIFSVSISTTPRREAAKQEWAAWRPPFAKYRVVVNNFNGGHLADGIRWPPAVEKALTDYLDHGGGLVNLHAANNAFLEWPAYNEMIGLGWRDKSFGPGLVVDERERIIVVPAGEGPNPGHGPRHDFVMTMHDPRHPITAGMQKHWLHPAEQLTHGQHAPSYGGVEKKLHVLSYAWSKDSLRNEPMDWLRSWGRGRVYTTMLGHTWQGEPNPNLRCIGFRTLFARGVEWAATGKVTLPVPADFPTAEAVRLV